MSQTRLMSTISTENITLRSQLVQTLERSSSVIHRSLSARAQGRKPCISNMLSRRQKRPPEGQKRPKISSTYVSISPSIGDMYVSLPISLSIYLSIYLSICQTCQADVNMQPAGQKCQLKHGRDTDGVSHVYQTCQADAKLGHLKAKKGHLKAKNFIHLCLYLSIHPRYVCYLSIDLSICQTCQADVNMQPAGDKCQLKHGRDTHGVSHVYQTYQADAKKGHLKAKNFIHLCLYLSIHRRYVRRYVCLSPYLPIYLSIDLSICQTCQADVNMQPAGEKCHLKHGRDTNGVSHVYQTCQADAKKGHLKAKKGHLKAKNFIHLCLYLSIHRRYVRRYVCLSPYLPIYLSIDRSIYLSVKLARPT